MVFSHIGSFTLTWIQIYYCSGPVGSNSHLSDELFQGLFLSAIIAALLDIGWMGIGPSLEDELLFYRSWAARGLLWEELLPTLDVSFCFPSSSLHLLSSVVFSISKLQSQGKKEKRFPATPPLKDIQSPDTSWFSLTFLIPWTALKAHCKLKHSPVLQSLCGLASLALLISAEFG